MNNDQPTSGNADEAAAPAPKKASRSRRATAAVASPASESTLAAASTEPSTPATPGTETAPAAPAKKTPVRRSRAKAAPAASEAPSLLDEIASPPAETDTPAAAEAKAPAAAKKTTRSRAKAAPKTASAETSTAQPVADAAATEPDAAGDAKADKPATRTTRTRAKSTKAAGKAAALADEPAPDTVAAAEAETVATDEAKNAAAAATAASEAAATVPATAPRAKRAPRRRASAPVTAPEAVQGELGLTIVSADEAAAASESQETIPALTAETVETAAAKATEVANDEDTAEAPARRSPRRRRGASAKATSNASSELASEAVSTEEAAADATAAVTGQSAAAVVPAEATVNEEVTAAEETPAPEETADAETGSPAVAAPLFQAPDAAFSGLFLAPDLSQVITPAPATEDDDAAEHEEGGRDGERRSRRSRRGRQRSAETHDEAAGSDEEDADAFVTEAEEVITSRRRRRRRRGDADLELTGGSDEDPPNTVTRVRAPRTPADSSTGRVTSLRGSTRLEAKKQRRRDSRDSGRRRTVITEAEFLARRESVDRVMVVRQADERIQIGVLEDGILAEHFVSKTQQDSLIGNVYLGKVQNVLPSMEAAFVDIGRGRNAVLYAGEVDWDSANLDGQPRRIENALKSGDSVLVQVTKDPVGHKGARLTSQISLPGRYLVFVPGGSMTGISRKLPDVERNRLKRVLKDHLPENAGVIVRTAAEGASEEELTNDINRLRAQWEGINNRASSTKTLAPEMLYGEPDLTIKVVRDVFNEDFSKLIVSGDDAWDTIEAYVTYVAPDLLDRLEKWNTPDDIFSAHRIDEQINKALERKVFLPSGGSLVIDRTEAMTVVDVNTGKFTGSGGNLEETVTKNNLEAAEEVVRQLRLRDIGGIIVIDFIDMVLESNRDLVLRRLVECLGRDRTKHQVAEVTSLGLVQMTRKRMGTGLLEVFGEQCSTCAGRGMVTHEIPVEHRRSHTPAIEAAHAQANNARHEHRESERTASRSTRSERKRNRNRSQQAMAEAEASIAAETTTDEAAEAAKAQKAHEARAALANIAAAAAASHHEDPAVADTAGVENSEPSVELQEETSATTTLNFGGESIELPRGHRSESSGFAAPKNAEQAAALADLAQALDQLAAPAAKDAAATEDAAAGKAVVEEKTAEPEKAPAAPAKATDPAAAPSSASQPRRARRNRSARSAQGGADTAVEVNEQIASAHGSTTHSNAATPEVTTPVTKEEPIIFGVGVPASEL